MFELTNEQRRCFAIAPVLDTWKKVEVKAGPHDNYATYAYLDEKRVVKVVIVSNKPGNDRYQEFGVNELLSDDETQILPKTSKGKPQSFTSASLIKKTGLGMYLTFYPKDIEVVNLNTQQCYYRSAYNEEKVETLQQFSEWVADWCSQTGERELAEINQFAERMRIHRKYKEGDFFRYRINRTLYGYGRIFVDYEKMRKEGIPFWNIFMGKPLCVAVYHIATENANLTPEQLVNLQMLPSQIIMDNIFYYGECEIIGHMPIAPGQENYTIHYGLDLGRERGKLCYQSGKTFVSCKGKKIISPNVGDLREENIFDHFLCGGFRNNGIGFYLKVKLPILLECIKQKSNEPYWDMIPQHAADQDLRNPKYKEELEQVKRQMGIKQENVTRKKVSEQPT